MGNGNNSVRILQGMLLLACFSSVPLSGQDIGELRSPGGNLPGEMSEELPEKAEQPLVFNQGTVPEELRRPQRGDEAMRYPRDAVIGELGQGAADDAAYRYARNLFQGVLTGNRESALLVQAKPALLEELFTGLEAVSPLGYRIGGGREEPDGSTSFLFRFIGREKGLAGELYLRRTEAGAWALEEVIVEEARDISEKGSTYRFDFSPYERFF
jgi:hypothetical protein